MLFDTTRFPLVFLKEDPQAHSHDTDTEAQLATLLERGERFVLLTDHLPGDHPEESHEDRKRRALFFKRHKERMRAFCAGLVIVTGERTIPAAVRLAAQGAGKVLGLSFDFVRSESEGVAAAERFLARG